MTTISSEAERLALRLEKMRGPHLGDGINEGVNAYELAVLLRRIPELEAERDKLRAELEKVRVPVGWSVDQNSDGSIQATMPNGDKWHFKQNYRPSETAWFAYRLLSAMLTADPTTPNADEKGAA